MLSDNSSEEEDPWNLEEEVDPWDIIDSSAAKGDLVMHEDGTMGFVQAAQEKSSIYDTATMVEEGIYGTGAESSEAGCAPTASNMDTGLRDNNEEGGPRGIYDDDAAEMYGVNEAPDLLSSMVSSQGPLHTSLTEPNGPTHESAPEAAGSNVVDPALAGLGLTPESLALATAWTPSDDG
eukprot:SAG31_NODE_10447_length_1137_cov_1.156069_1_plen_178_part_10